MFSQCILYISADNSLINIKLVPNSLAYLSKAITKLLIKNLDNLTVSRSSLSYGGAETYRIKN